MNTNIYICCYLNKPLRKNMHKSIPMVFAILALVIIIFSCACVSQPPANQTSQQNGGLTQITVPSETTFISYEEAKANFIAYRSYELSDPVNATTVNYLRSRDVDGSGNATGWIFGIYNGPDAEFLVYDRTGWTTIANAILPSEEINLDRCCIPRQFIQPEQSSDFR